MSGDLSLSVLSELHALESRPRAQALRREYGIELLENVDEVNAWLRAKLEARAEETALRLSRHLNNEGCAHYAWIASSPLGETGYYPAASDELVALAREAFALHERAGWHPDEAVLFILMDATPELKPVTYTIAIDLAPGSRRFDSRIATPLSDLITLTVRPQATEREVVDAFKRALEQLYGRAGMARRKRQRPMTSQRARDLAVIGGRIVLGEFDSWKDALEFYEKEHPADPTYQDVTRYSQAELLGRFRRDVRMHYKRVTGSLLEWRPSRSDDVRTPPAKPGIDYM